jgi:uncharacterized protein YkwD
MTRIRLGGCVLVTIVVVASLGLFWDAASHAAGAAQREGLASSRSVQVIENALRRVDTFVRWLHVWRLSEFSDELLKLSLKQLHSIKGAGPSRGAPVTITPPVVSAPTARIGQDCLDNEAALSIAGLTNVERAQAGLPAFIIDQGLMALASGRSRSLIADFSHNGLRTVCATCGENIGWRLAAGFTPAGQVAGWMQSTEGHKENMLSRVGTRMGAGVCRAMDGRVYSVLDIKP